MEVAVRRPQRWDAPLSDSMREVDVDHLLAIEPFRSIDPAAFPASLPLRDILQNDCRIVRCRSGDIVVREGDYGSSAFFILAGALRVVLRGLDAETLGRPPRKTLGWFAAAERALRRPKLAEVRRDLAKPASEDSTVGRSRRDDGDDSPRIFLQDVPRVLRDAETTVLEPGELFGELAALTRSPRSATVFAEGEAVLLEIRWQGLRDVMRRTDVLRRHVETLYRQNSLQVHLRETPLLSDLPAEQLHAVAAATKFEAHGEYDWHVAFAATVQRRPEDALLDEPLIAEEGTPAAGLILVRTGFARRSRRQGAGHLTLDYLGRGRVFGLAEAIESAAVGRPVPWKDSLRALGYVDVLRIPQQAIVELVLPYVSPAAMERALGRPAEQTRSRRSAPTAAAAELAIATGSESCGGALGQGLLEILGDRRLINGTAAMVIHLDRCTRCDDCVRACAATHDNNPRFVRQGPRSGPLQFAQACMHCVDPVCMIGCPTGAIARDESTGVVRINDRTCIGCTICATSCPYDNIRMVEVRDPRGVTAIDAALGQPILKATKCDLCAEQPLGPACQRACPHDALVRLDLGNLGGLSQWLGR